MSKIIALECIQVKDNGVPIESASVDMALVVTVLHEISNKEDFLLEIKRILNKRKSCFDRIS